MLKENYTVKPIGIIRSKYQPGDDIPIQGIFDNKTVAHIEIYDEYTAGLKDLNDFSHAILIYIFNYTDKITLVGQPFLENEHHGIFSIRSPFRPNHIGISTVRIQKIEGNKLYFKGADMYDKTPLIDIKPYIKYFDKQKNVRSGWVDKHFADGNIPEKTINKSFNK